MKVFNLACEHDHLFEGWFASSEAFDEQQARGLIECPICNSKSIRKMPAAPRLNLSAAKQAAELKASAPTAMPTPQQLHAMWTKMARHLVENTEDVGERFAEEARRIHYQEAPERGIRGVATQDERAELEAEGIEVLSFPMPRAAKEPLQ